MPTRSEATRRKQAEGARAIWAKRTAEERRAHTEPARAKALARRKQAMALLAAAEAAGLVTPGSAR
jgi:hypothetical protein